MQSSNKGNDKKSAKGQAGPSQRRQEKGEANMKVRQAARKVEKALDPDAVSRPMWGCNWWD